MDRGNEDFSEVPDSKEMSSVVSSAEANAVTES